MYNFVYEKANTLEEVEKIIQQSELTLETGQIWGDKI